MKGLILYSLTPFVSSDIESRQERKGDFVLNIVYCTAAMISILSLAIIDPWNFGHMLTGAVTMLIYVFLGVRIQQIRYDDFRDQKQDYYFFLLNFTLNQDITNADVRFAASAIVNPIEAEEQICSLPTAKSKKRGRKKLEDGESPFIDADYSLFFNKKMESMPDYSLSGVDVNAIAKVLQTRLNKNNCPTKCYASVPTITMWIMTHYQNKIALGLQYVTLMKATPSEARIVYWKKFFQRT